MLTISTDKALLNRDFITNFLLNDSYWANNRTAEIIEKSIENSVCFGLYTRGEQIGFARVVTDFSVFAWLCDVFIAHEHRGKTYGKKLIQEVINHPDLKSVIKWNLATKDAHGLYVNNGFTTLNNPEFYMERKKL